MRWPTQSSAATLLDLKDELGDLLLQVVFHAQMAEEARLFDFGDVIEAIRPSSSAAIPTSLATSATFRPKASSGLWGEIKASEKAERRAARLAAGLPEESGSTGLLAGITPALPCPHACSEAPGEGLYCRLRLE